MASSGPNSPGTITETADVVGLKVWANLANGGASDNSYATCSLAGSTSKQITFTNLGFSITSGSVINGIVAEVEVKSANGVETLAYAQLYNGGSIGSTKLPGTVIGTSDSYQTIGGISDKWGATLTTAIVNGSGFGFWVAFDDAAPNTGSISVDHGRLTVYYTPPGGRPKYFKSTKVWRSFR